MGGGKGGSSTTVQSVNPYQAAQADFLFNRFNQNTPTGSLVFTPPGQQAPPQQQVGFMQGGLSNQAQQMFGGQGGKSAPPSQPPRHHSDMSAYGTSFGQNLLAQTGGQGPQATAQPSGPQAHSRGSTAGIGGMIGNVVGQAAGSAQNPFTANTTPATATQVLPAAVLALENARTTTTANTLADTLARQQAMTNNGLPALTTSLNSSGLPSGQAGFSGLPQTPGSPEQFRQDTINTMFNLGAQPLQREFGRNLDTLEQSLANKGLALGGDAASRALGDFSREQSQALSDLASRSVLAGGAEASRSLGDILNTRGQLTSEQQAVFGQNEALRQGRLQEQLQNASLSQGARLQQLNELNALLGLQQVGAPPLQSFLGTSPTGVMDAFGLQQNAQIANASNAANTKGSQLGGLASLGGAGILALSDRRFKSDIRKLGVINGTNIYAYDIAGEESVGVMADEVPWAAIDVGGVKMVDYARVF